jgi:lipid II:glycine glycyltransferase (peptidoglycan interpeptide bridge formation enzyme)
MMIQYIKKFNFVGNLKYGLTYFDESYNPSGVDIIQEFQYSQKRKFSKDFYTLLIDLGKKPEDLFSCFEKNTKYEINRARNKDGVLIETLDAAKEKDAFYDFYNRFALTKNREPIGTAEIDSLVANNMFTLRAASFEGERLIYHSYITANNRARLAQSASLFRASDNPAFRALTGRANRLLHWDDILYFKDRGYKIYDLGGVTPDKSNNEGQAIARFKECFGGSLVKEYKSWIPVSFKGWMLFCFKVLCGGL